MIDRRRRHHHVNPAPVVETAVDRRGGAIDAEPEGGDDPLDGGLEVGIAGESGLDPAERAAAVDPYLLGPVDQDVGDGRVGVAARPRTGAAPPRLSPPNAATGRCLRQCHR
jgi:hypothetical protein